MNNTLYSQSEITKMQGWLGDMGRQILERFNGDNAKQKALFPCLFARKAFAQGIVKFLPIAYVQDKVQYDLECFAQGLKNYLELAMSVWDGKFNTAYPLLVVFEPVQGYSQTKDYQDIFVQALQYLIDNDEKSWVGEIPLNPNQEFWTMCFHGVQIFINASHPNHHLRLSRNLCDTLVLVINPRECFDIFAGDNESGYAIREQIRKNIDNYDLISRSPLLGHYQLGELEWVQYMLPVTNDEEPMQCPLSFERHHKK